MEKRRANKTNSILFIPTSLQQAFMIILIAIYK